MAGPVCHQSSPFNSERKPLSGYRSSTQSEPGSPSAWTKPEMEPRTGNQDATYLDGCRMRVSEWGLPEAAGSDPQAGARDRDEPPAVLLLVPFVVGPWCAADRPTNRLGQGRRWASPAVAAGRGCPVHEQRRDRCSAATIATATTKPSIPPRPPPARHRAVHPAVPGTVGERG